MTQDELKAVADMVAARLLLSSKEVLTLEEAAQYLGVSKSQMYQLTHTRAIPHSKPRGKMCYFSRRALEDWMMDSPVATQTDINTAAMEYCMTHESPAGPAGKRRRAKKCATEKTQ